MSFNVPRFCERRETITSCHNNMALFWILFLTLCFTFSFVSSKATMSVKEARSEPYTVSVVCCNFRHSGDHGTKILVNLIFLKAMTYKMSDKHSLMYLPHGT